MKKSFLLLALFVPLLSFGQIDEKSVEAFITEFVKENQADESNLRRIMAEASYKQDIIDKISRPAEGSMTWERYRRIFITDERIEAGVAFWKEHAESLSKISEESGVAEEIILGIIGVETYFGRIKGDYRVIDALYTIGFGYPKRGSYFKRELGKFLEMTTREGLDPLTIKGSYAGAMGYTQFMPSSYLAYAKSFDDDGSADLMNDPEDALASVANYLKVHRWKTGAPVATKATFTRKVTNLNKQSLKPKNQLSDYTALGITPEKSYPGSTPATLIILENESDKEYWYGFDNFYVITRYNHSPMYAMAVFQLAEAMKAKMNP